MEKAEKILADLAGMKSSYRFWEATLCKFCDTQAHRGPDGKFYINHPDTCIWERAWLFTTSLLQDSEEIAENPGNAEAS